MGNACAENTWPEPKKGVTGDRHARGVAGRETGDVLCEAGAQKDMRRTEGGKEFSADFIAATQTWRGP